MGQLFDFLAIFQYNFDDSWDIHGMLSIILGFFFNNYDGNKFILFQDLHDPRRVIVSKLSIDFNRTYDRGVVDIDLTMACDISM